MNGTDNLTFLPALKLLGIIALFIGTLLGIMFFLNKQRNETIVADYTEEITAYAEQNASGLNLVFGPIFDQGKLCGKQGYMIYEDRANCFSLVREAIYKNIKTDLRDFSSSNFIRLNGNTVETLTLDGEVFEGTYEYRESNSKEAKILSLLNNEVNQIPWDDYFYTMSGKEVVVPFDYQGKRIGAIVHRVIEE